MNYPEDGYKTMLASFRTNDLQTLLGAFGRNKAGRKSELKDRAVDLLRNRPPGFNSQAYITKIIEIYRSMQNDVPNNDVLRTLMQNQQRQMISLQTQQRMYPPPQYAPQSMHLTRAGLPQVMPQMSRGMYNNNMAPNNPNIQYSYQPTIPRNMSQVPSTQQLNMISSDAPMSYNMNVVGGVNNSYVQPPAPPLSMNNIKFKKLPFYEVLDEIIKPTILMGQERCTLPNVPRDVREVTFKFQMTAKQATEIAMNRDISLGKCDYPIQMQIRICHLESGLLEISDCMPIGIAIRIGGKCCPLPPTASNIRPGAEARRIPRPINCSHYLKLNPNIHNSIIVNWNPDGKTYVIGMYLVKRLSSDILTKLLQEKVGRSSEETKSCIIKKLADVDPDLATTSYRFSLVCPLGKMRMKIPAKSINCDHLQCFDASIFILMNEKKPTWLCPTCNKPCNYDDIQIESYFLDIVSSPTLPDSCKEIEILADGTWRVYEEIKETKDQETPQNTKEKPIDSVDLDDSDDETSVELKKEVNPECSKETNDVVLKSSFVDLTISDDEEGGPSKSKHEDEAQTTDAPQILANAVDLIPQIQPKQAVSSSEQGDVIEIGSPTPPSSPVAPPSAPS